MGAHSQQKAHKVPQSSIRSPQNLHNGLVLIETKVYCGFAAPSIDNAPDRLRVPLKRVGEHGDNRWQEISYEQAMDEIAERLKKVVAEYGPEGMAV